VPAFLADESQVGDGAIFLIHDLEDMSQVAHLLQVIFGMGLGNQLEPGTAFSQEEFDNLLVIFDLGLERVRHPGLGKPGVVDVDRPAYQEQRDKGANQGDPDELAVEFGVMTLAPLFLGSLAADPVFLLCLFHLAFHP